MEHLRLFECPDHGEDFDHPDCFHCTNINKRIAENKEVADRFRDIPRVKLEEEVYWPQKMGHMGRTIENLAHTPQHFESKRAFRTYLHDHNLREAGG